MNTTSSRIYSKNSLSKIGKKINYLGLKIESTTFNTLRLTTTITLFIILIFCNYGYIFAPLFTIIYYIAFEYILLDLNIIRRRKKIEESSIEFFSLFLTNLNTNRNIKKTLINTCQILNNNYLSYEFNKVINDTELGKTFDESLKLMTTRIPSEIIVNIICSLTEANRTGNSINNSIKEQLDFLILKRNEKIINSNKIIPIKMLLICIIFITIMLLVIFIYSKKII